MAQGGGGAPEKIADAIAAGEAWIAAKLA